MSRFFSLVGIGVLLIACQRQPSSETPSVVGGSYELSAAELHRLEKLADGGDAEAALKVSQHYGLGLSDDQQERRWLQRAAELGSALAQYNLATYLAGEGQYQSARTWFSRAVERARQDGNGKIERDAEEGLKHLPPGN